MLAEQQEKLLEQQQALLAQIADARNQKRKDFWDRVGAIAPILSGTIIAIGGTFFTMSYNEQQLKLQEVQTIERFIPHLLGDEKSKRAAILAISTLADAKLAAKMASIFASPGTVSALESIAENDNTVDRKVMKNALARALDNMAESYRADNRYEDAIVAYKKALSLQEQALGGGSPELIPNLNRIAELCIIHKDYKESEQLLKRAADIQKSASGADSSRYAEQLRRLASLYKEEGLEAKSQSIMNQAIAIEQKLPATTSGGSAGLASEPPNEPAERNMEQSAAASSNSQGTEKSKRSEEAAAESHASTQAAESTRSSSESGGKGGALERSGLNEASSQDLSKSLDSAESGRETESTSAPSSKTEH